MTNKFGGMTKEQYLDFLKRLKDPKDPTGNYRTPGGDRFNVNTMTPQAKKKDEDEWKVKISSAKPKKKSKKSYG